MPSRRLFLLALFLLVPQPALAAGPANKYLKKGADWFASAEAKQIAANILSYQADLGGWPKNIDTTAKPYTGDRKELKGTFDNSATTDELRFLARIFNATKDETYRTAFTKGYEYILKAQYPTGGWPQQYPPPKSYHRHITFNDDAMVRLMEFVRETQAADVYGFVDAQHKKAAQKAFDHGVECILKCQIKVAGNLTVWCAQHDETDLSPRPARPYELISLSGSESVGITRLLMSLENPSPEVKRAIEGAVTWFRDSRLPGIRMESRADPKAPKGKDRVVVKDAAAPGMWGRFYEIDTNKPIFSDRDGVKKYALAEIGYERRNGYSWLGTWPQRLLDVDYPTWKKRLAARIDAQNVQPRGYTIPLIDLNDQTTRQVVVDREKGQYLGHPTTVLLEDGKTILCVYPKGHGKGAIVYKKSTDGGKTWSERLPTPASWATSKETPTIHRVVDAQGTKRLILWSGLYPARMSVSSDDGKSWSELKPAGNWGGIVVMGFVEKLTTPGHYLAMFHDDGRYFTEKSQAKKPVEFTLYKTFSTDGGLTWSFPEAVYRNTEVHLCEPGCIRSPDGFKLAVLLRENSRKQNSHVIFSNDEGKSWSQPRELPGALTGDRHTGVYAPDGRLFISFRDTTLESPTKGDWIAWVGTYDDIVKGREGQYRVRLKKNTKASDCAYPGVEILPDSTIVTTTYGHWDKGEPAYILSVRLNLKELDSQVKR